MSRLSKFISKLISLNQKAFLACRWIGENSVLAQELIHKVKNHNGKVVLMLLHLEMKKAYDCMEWCFIDNVLKIWGFSNELRSLIFSSFSLVEYTLC